MQIRINVVLAMLNRSVVMHGGLLRLNRIKVDPSDSHCLDENNNGDMVN
jgi:hypothetical protein